MANDEKRHEHKKQTVKSKGKMKSRWKKPGKILNIGNRERGEGFSIHVTALKAGNFRLCKSDFYMEQACAYKLMFLEHFFFLNVNKTNRAIRWITIY